MSDEMKHLNVKIADMISHEQRMKCHKMKKFCDQSGSKNIAEMWNLKKRLWPKNKMTLPEAKINHQGKLISNPKDIKILLEKNRVKDSVRDQNIR